MYTPEANLWKYVGDVFISEFPTKNKGASIQSTLDIVSSLAWMILMELNAKKSEKCKELRACFFKGTPQLSSLQIDGQVLETVRSHKFLGLVIEDSLKWNEHICMIVSKVPKRLHIMRVLSVTSTLLILLISTLLSYVPS